MGTQLPPEKGHTHSTQFLAHVNCGHTAGWIKMALGMEIGLSPGDFVLDGDPAPPPQKGNGAPLPNLRPTSIVAKRLLHQDPLGMDVGRSTGDFC